MMKKTMLRAAAAALTAAMLAPLPANALAPLDTALDFEVPEDYIPISNGEFLEKHMNYYIVGNESVFYASPDGTRIIGVKAFRSKTTVFKLADGVTPDDISAAISELYEEGSSYGDYLHGGRFKTLNSITYAAIPLTNEQAVQYCELFKEKGLITSCTIQSELQKAQEIFTNGIGFYELTTYDIETMERVPTESLIKPVIESELPGFTLEEVSGHSAMYPNISRDYLVVVPPEGTDISEQIRAAEKIYAATGLSIAGETVHVMASKASVDVLNAVKGDANNDKSVTVADAVAILQSIANKDKYALTPQGSFNADIAGNYDGVTANDALAIQKLDSESLL